MKEAQKVTSFGARFGDAPCYLQVANVPFPVLTFISLTEQTLQDSHFI